MLCCVLLLQEVAVTPVAHHLPPGSLCQLAWALGQLGFWPNSQLMRTLLRCSGRGMSFLQGQDLCQLLQGLVKLQVQPPPLWLDACCARVLQVRLKRTGAQQQWGSSRHGAVCVRQEHLGVHAHH